MSGQKKNSTSHGKNLTIEGVIPPMMTPFREDERVDYHAFVRNIQRWNKEQLGGYLVLGSNSEASYLSESEKLKLIKLTVDNAKRGRTVIAGTGLESARETVHLTVKAANLGVDVALVLTPAYYIEQMSDDALISHFTYVADHSPIPILMYNVPKFTHVNVSLNVVRHLCDHPNIVGMKDSKGDIAQLEQFKRSTPGHFHVIAGSASVWYPSLQFGIAAGILALSNFAGNRCARIQTLFNAGELNEAGELHRRLLPVNVAITITHGVPGLKYAATLAGYEGGFVRRPLQPLNEDAKKDIRTVLIKAGFPG